ncbi:hypothetical protein MPSEU_000970000 [Mayamaea pseudoterrestris]|nr:hypothetical protein MPSEU_000970000 [Mayamaea pseudoterrestris]
MSSAYLKTPQIPLSLVLLHEITDTFLASVRSVGTAVTLALVGVYMHRRKLVEGNGKRTLALLSQQVTFPLFLFTKIVYCNQDWSSEACPNITSSLHTVWFLLFWPLVVVGCGLLVGSFVVRVSDTPIHQRRACLAAVAFGNSSGLPITLLTVVHANFPATSDLGRIDPTLFLSIYLLIYPMLQWGIGGSLLAPYDEEEAKRSRSDSSDENNGYAAANHGTFAHATTAIPQMPPPRQFGTAGPRRSSAAEKSLSQTLSEAFCHNVLNNKNRSQSQTTHPSNDHAERNISSLDEGNYISEVDLMQLGKDATNDEMDFQQLSLSVYQGTMKGPQTPESDTSDDESSDSPSSNAVKHQLMQRDAEVGYSIDERRSLLARAQCDSQSKPALHQFDTDTVYSMVQTILQRSLQPPVIGSLLGVFVALIHPLRGIFVDVETRSSRATLQWFFDGLYAVGLSAVPLNMMILGCNISASLGNSKTMVYHSDDRIRAGLLSWKTMVWIAIGKLLILPLVGISLCYCLKKYVWKLPDDIDGAVYLVLMIVFLTPTANNVMVIVELGLSTGAKEGIAQAIALQYAFAPLVLSITMTMAIGVASDWS